jgi:peptidoglycan/LPS O-acetylase OafA/YrhL
MTRLRQVAASLFVVMVVLVLACSRAGSFAAVSHHFALSRLPEPSAFGHHSLGGIGVLIFFTISGFLVAQSWDRDPHLWRFAMRRVLRIWPGLFVTLALCALVLGPAVTEMSVREYFSSPLVRSFFGMLWMEVQPTLPGVFLNSPVPGVPNGALWTIPLEVKCYIYLGLLGIAGVLKRPQIFLLIASSLFIYIYGIVDLDRALDAGLRRPFKWEFATYFVAGAAFHYFPWVWSSPKRQLYLGSGLALAACAAGATGRPLLACWILLPFAALVVATSSTPVLRRFGRFGDLSFGIYIYGFPVQQTVLWALPEWSFAKSLMLVTATTIILAWLSWHLVEKQALRLKPQKETGAHPFVMRKAA